MDQTLRDQQVANAKIIAATGNKREAAKLFIQLIRERPNDPTPWLEMEGVLDNPEQKKECLERVLKLDPNNNKAKKRLSELFLAQVETPQQVQKAITSQQPEHRYCIYCGNELSLKAEFCGKCGRPVPGPDQPLIQPRQTDSTSSSTAQQNPDRGFSGISSGQIPAANPSPAQVYIPQNVNWSNPNNAVQNSNLRSNEPNTMAVFWQFFWIFLVLTTVLGILDYIIALSSDADTPQILDGIETVICSFLVPSILQSRHFKRDSLIIAGFSAIFFSMLATWILNLLVKPQNINYYLPQIFAFSILAMLLSVAIFNKPPVYANLQAQAQNDFPAEPGDTVTASQTSLLANRTGILLTFIAALSLIYSGYFIIMRILYLFPSSFTSNTSLENNESAQNIIFLIVSAILFFLLAILFIKDHHFSRYQIIIGGGLAALVLDFLCFRYTPFFWIGLPINCLLLYLGTWLFAPKTTNRRL